MDAFKNNPSYLELEMEPVERGFLCRGSGFGEALGLPRGDAGLPLLEVWWIFLFLLWLERGVCGSCCLSRFSQNVP